MARMETERVTSASLYRTRRMHRNIKWPIGARRRGKDETCCAHRDYWIGEEDRTQLVNVKLVYSPGLDSMMWENDFWPTFFAHSHESQFILRTDVSLPSALLRKSYAIQLIVRLGTRRDW